MLITSLTDLLSTTFAGLWALGRDPLGQLPVNALGVILALLYESRRRPRLKITVHDRTSSGKEYPLGSVVWLHVRVTNLKKPRWQTIFQDPEAALACRAWVAFFHLDGNAVFKPEMPARWANTEEPIPIFANAGNITWARLVNVQQTFDIPAENSGDLDVVCRFEGEESCYGFNNDSYLHRFRNNTWKLPPGRYIIRVRVRTGGREFAELFMLHNDVSLEHFRFDPLTPEQRRQHERWLRRQ